MENNQNNPTVTVSIITCYGGASILDSVKSLRESKDIAPFRFIIVADRNGIEPEVKAMLEQYDVELIEKVGEEWTPHRKWELIRSMTTTDLLVLTQDDIVFEPDALAKTVRQFKERPETTIANIRNIPVKPQNWFEAGVNVGTHLVNRIGELWNNGDNYLGLLGRAMVIRTDWFRKFDLPDEVVSSDAYFYFLNRKLGGVYYNMGEARIFFRNPQNMLEHWRKSSRFQHSKHEMSQYFKQDLEAEYRAPRGVILRASLEELFTNPLAFVTYVGIYFYTRLFKEKAEKALIANWEIDESTKHVLK